MNNEDKKIPESIEVIQGDGKNLNISPVYDHIKDTEPKPSSKKPKNINSLVFNPEAINAFTKAHAPGIGITSIFSSMAFFITSSPGSQIPGVPASETNAMFLPSCNFSIKTSDFTSSLCR